VLRLIIRESLVQAQVGQQIENQAFTRQKVNAFFMGFAHNLHTKSSEIVAKLSECAEVNH